MYICREYFSVLLIYRFKFLFQLYDSTKILITKFKYHFRPQLIFQLKYLPEIIKKIAYLKDRVYLYLIEI